MVKKLSTLLILLSSISFLKAQTATINGITNQTIGGIGPGSLSSSNITENGSCGVSGAGSIALGGSGTTKLSITVNAQTGTTYTVSSSDCGKLVTFNNASTISVTLPQATGSFTSGFSFYVQNVGAGTVTITPTTSTINGASSLAVTTGQGLMIVSDGTNWQTILGALSLGATVVKTNQANTYTSGLQDFSAVGIKINSGSSNPATCGVGQLFFNSTSTAGQNLWECTATNTWTQQLLGTGLTNPMTSAGDGISASAGGTPIRVAGNATTVPGFYIDIGNGTTPGTPSWIPSTSAIFAENVLMHGVTGNCSTDDTSAIQAVLNTYPIVYFPRAPGGCYKISSALIMKSNQRIIGSGFADNGIKQTSTTADAIDAKATLSGSRNIEIDNLNITDGVLATRTTGHGIWIDGTSDTAILHLSGNQIYGFEDGEHLVNPINSYIIGDRANNSIQNSFSVTGPSTSTNFISTYGDAPGNHCYNIGDLQYSAFLGTACDAATVDGYHFYAESGGRPKNITLIPSGNETAGRYGIYTEGQSFSIINPAISGIPTGSGKACIALMNAVQIHIQGGQCVGGDYGINVLGDPNFLPYAYQGTNRVEDFYSSGQAIAAYHDPSGYLNISSSKRNYFGTVPVTQLHEVTTPMMLATALTTTGVLNYVNQEFDYKGGGTYTTNADETGTTLTFTLNACDSNTCGSTRKILATWTTATVGSTGNPYTNSWNINAGCQVATTGSTGTLICHGTLIAATTAGGSPTILNDNNSTAVTLDTTAQWYIGVMVQKSSIKDTGITQDMNSVMFKSY